MDRLAALKAFVAVVEQQGFAAAARARGQSRSAINRLVIGLEDDLGVQLLNRTTRRVAPTANGAAFYARVVPLLSALAEAEADVTEAQQAATGRLRVNAPMSFGILHLAPAVSDFMTRHPDLRVELQLNDRIIDIIDEGFDLAVRISTPQEETSLVDFRLCAVHRVICAAPDYVVAHGAPSHWSELRTRACLHYDNMPGGDFWRLAGADGEVTVPVNAVLTSNNGEALRDAALRGLGITLLPSFIVGPDLREKRLVRVLPDYRPSSLTLSAIYPPTRHLSAKIRLFTDHLLERFGAEPYWDDAA